MSNTQRNNITYFEVFKIWLNANILLSFLGLAASFITHMQFKKSLTDTLTLTLYSVIAGFFMTLPSLVILMFAKFIYKLNNFRYCSLFKYYFTFICLINLLYFIFLWIFDSIFFKEWGVISLICTLACGVISLKFVIRKRKITHLSE